MKANIIKRLILGLSLAGIIVLSPISTVMASANADSPAVARTKAWDGIEQTLGGVPESVLKIEYKGSIFYLGKDVTEADFLTVIAAGPEAVRMKPPKDNGKLYNYPVYILWNGDKTVLLVHPITFSYDDILESVSIPTDPPTSLTGKQAAIAAPKKALTGQEAIDYMLSVEYVDAVRTEFYRLLNEHRVSNGLKELEINSELQDYADIRADEQRTRAVLEFVDNGYSGTDIERPAVQEMLELLRCSGINCVVVKDFSRFSRNALESGYYIEQVFPLYGVRFIAVGDYFDSNDYTDGTGGIDVAFKFLIHEYYSKDLSKKIKSSLHIRMKNGEHIVAGAIYGYRKNENGKWELDPPAAEVAREIFDMALDGKTTAQIRDKLFSDRRLAPREYEHRNKGKDITPEFNWATRQIWRILTNEQYTGSYVAGKQETTRIGGKSLTVNDKTKWIIIPDSHPAIVSKEDFERVQVILKSPKDALPSDRERSVQAKKLYDKIENGERKPAASLFGYYINSRKALEIDDTAAEAVKLIFDLAMQGCTARDIAEELQRARHLPPGEYFKLERGLNIQPTYQWPTLRVREILKNEQYTGAYIAGRTYQDDNGRKYHTPPSKWIIIPDKHPSIVSKEVFEQVKTLISQGKRKMQPHNYLLKGKIVCGSCGHAMIYGNTTTQPMYRCMKTHADPTAACHKLKVSAAEVENAIMTIIKKKAELVLESGDLSELSKTNTDEKRIYECEKQIHQYVEQRQSYYEQFIQGEIDRDAFNALKDECSAQLEKLNTRLALLKQAERDKQASKKMSALAKEALSETATPQDVVNALVDKILVFPNDRIEIRWKFVDFAAGI